MEDKVIYGVSSGSYSDYRVNSIFKTKELADEWLRRHKRANSWHDYEVEEFPFISELPPETPPVRVYTVWINLDGLSVRWETGDYFCDAKEHVPPDDTGERYHQAFVGGVPTEVAVGYSHVSYHKAQLAAIRWLNSHRHEVQPEVSVETHVVNHEVKQRVYPY